MFVHIEYVYLFWEKKSCCLYIVIYNYFYAVSLSFSRCAGMDFSNIGEFTPKWDCACIHVEYTKTLPPPAYKNAHTPEIAAG